MAKQSTRKQQKAPRSQQPKQLRAKTAQVELNSITPYLEQERASGLPLADGWYTPIWTEVETHPLWSQLNIYWRNGFLSLSRNALIYTHRLENLLCLVMEDGCSIAALGDEQEFLPITLFELSPEAIIANLVDFSSKPVVRA